MKIYKGRFSFFFFRISISKIKFQTISSFSFDTRASLYDNPKRSIAHPFPKWICKYFFRCPINRNLFLNISATYVEQNIINGVAGNFLIIKKYQLKKEDDVSKYEKREENLTVMGQNVMFESALQMEPVLAYIALEPSHPCVRQLVGLQHGRSLELGWAEVALERRVGCVNDHVRPEAARPEESLLADRALERLHVRVHQLVIAQRLPVEQLLLADTALERPSARVHLGLVHPQLVPLLEFEPAGNWLRNRENRCLDLVSVSSIIFFSFPLFFSIVIGRAKDIRKEWNTWNRRLQCLHMNALNVSWRRRWSLSADDLGTKYHNWLDYCAILQKIGDIDRINIDRNNDRLLIFG